MLENSLYKDRGYTGCLRAAFELVCAKLGIIMRATWLFALLYSIGIGIYLFMPFFWGKAMSLLFVVFFAVITMAKVVTLLNAKSFRHNMKCCLTVYCINIVGMTLYAGVTFGIIYGLMNTLAKGIIPTNVYGYIVYASVLFFMGVLLFVFGMPLAYSEIKYIVEADVSFVSIFKNAYRQGLRSWGFLAVVYILAIIILLSLSFVLYLPFIVMYMAMQSDAQGVMMGDATALPVYFTALRFSVNVFTAFLSMYTSIWFGLVFFYAYGRIESRLRAREELDKTD